MAKPDTLDELEKLVGKPRKLIKLNQIKIQIKSLALRLTGTSSVILLAVQSASATNPNRGNSKAKANVEQRKFPKGYEALCKATDLRSDYEDAWRTRAFCALAQKDYAKTLADANLR